MLPQEIIRIKRNGSALTAADIRAFILGVTEHKISDAQIAAFCMAALLNGLDRDECIALTMAMAESGTRIDWKKHDLDGPVLDKHSTGGVGDKVSIILAPVLAACGAYVPMISGRGLGHTGGTLDKMDSIPGYHTTPALDNLIGIVKNAGCAIVGATHEFAPADRAIYAVRDVTATVEDINLITASILAKKLAAGLDGLVMDVKCGNGAFMTDVEQAGKLAGNIIDIAEGAGLPCSAIISDMNEVLGRTAGNAIEVREAIEALRGDACDERLYEVVITLAGEILSAGKITANREAGMAAAKKALESGRAAEIFGKMVADLGGPADIVEQFEKHMELAGETTELHSDDVGVVESVDTRAIGLAIVELGGGRRQVDDSIDYDVGLSSIAEIGETVGPSERPLCMIHGNDKEKAAKAAARIKKAYKLAAPGTKIEKSPVVHDIIRM